MNLHALRVFMEVAKENSLTKASKKLLISQPAITMQIKKLEQELGLKLVCTNGRGIKLSEAGQFLFDNARYLFKLEESIENKLIDFRNQKKESLRIASTYLPASYFLPKWLAEFKKIYSDIDINLYSNNSQETIKNLLSHNADVAFVVKEKWVSPELNMIHLCDVDFWFIVSSSNKYAGKIIELSQLLKEPFLLREKGSSTRELLLSICKKNDLPMPNIGIQFHGLTESIQTVIAGYGVMLAPSLMVDKYLERGEIGIIKVNGIDIKRPIYLCQRSNDNNVSISMQKFIKLIQKNIN